MGAFVEALANRFREVDERLRAFEHAQRNSSPPESLRGSSECPLHFPAV